jgi:hypothetical protein
MLKDGSIQLPCKPGDYVYQIDIGTKKLNTLKVQEINIYMTEKNFQMQVITHPIGMYFHRQFGKSIFLNKTDAMDELKRLLEEEAAWTKKD